MGKGEMGESLCFVLIAECLLAHSTTKSILTILELEGMHFRFNTEYLS